MAKRSRFYIPVFFLVGILFFSVILLPLPTEDTYGAGTAPASTAEEPSREKPGEEGFIHATQVFFRHYGSDIARATHRHVYLVFISLITAVIIAVPLGIYLTRCPWPRLISVVMGGVGAIQTIPALALIAFIVLLFAVIQPMVRPFFHLSTIGIQPALLALVLYALLPILRNTFTSLNQVDPAVKEVATGMGMRPYQVLFKVELPLALPVIMAGIRIATVWTIGIATLCGLIGAGGLGKFIFSGVARYQMSLLIAGTIPAALLALVADWLLGRLENWLTPAGISPD